MCGCKSYKQHKGIRQPFKQTKRRKVQHIDSTGHITFKTSKKITEKYINANV